MNAHKLQTFTETSTVLFRIEHDSEPWIDELTSVRAKLHLSIVRDNVS